MATYGRTNSLIPFTGFTPTLGANTTGNANNNATSGGVQFNGLGQSDLRLVQQLRSAGNRALRSIILSLTGAAPGATATYNRVQINPVNAQDIGGQETITSVPVINRATTAADVTALTAMLNRTSYPITYPVDPSLNGGGGRGAW